jgi:FKBP-type peptidyl-prolyl cis-trans isomerase 2/predicted small secreted protein
MFKVGYIILVVVLLTGAVLTGCNSISTGGGAKDGDMVQVNYTGKLADGTVFDSSIGKDPIEFTLGKGDMIPAFEKAVLGMKVGDKKTITIPADEAYGPHLDDMVVEVPRERLPSDIEPKVGLMLEAKQPDGSKIQFIITNISDNNTVTLDANHPLAGKDLTFDIELVKISQN